MSLLQPFKVHLELLILLFVYGVSDTIVIDVRCAVRACIELYTMFSGVYFNIPGALCMRPCLVLRVEYTCNWGKHEQALHLIVMCVPGLVFPQSLLGGQDGQLVHLSASVLCCPFSVHLLLVLFLSSGLFSESQWRDSWKFTYTHFHTILL